MVGVGSHFSPHTLIDLPSPTLHIKPSTSKSMELKMLLHANDGQDPKEPPRRKSVENTWL
jgi:hypothetical protein